MGKKSLIKSTSKKKRAPKKAATSKNPKKKPPAKKTAAKAKPAAKTTKKTMPKKAAAKAKPSSVKNLLKKQFDVFVPKPLYTVPADKVEKSTFSAPGLLDGFDAADTERIKGLLANTYSEKDLKAAAGKAPAAKKAAPKSKPVSIKDLINKKFDIVEPKQRYSVPADMTEQSTFTAPELLDGYNADEVKRIKGLLSNTYTAKDLKAAAEKAAAEKAAAEKAAAEKAAAEKAAAEKAAAEKAAAEKAAAEKAAAEKAAAEKAAAEKAAAEKAAAEKAAAEKAAAEKAAAEKAAAEKAAAEKAAAEKAAAEKAAAEKAAAEKAAAEKAAAEKAAAEKAAAEKAAAEKAAAEKAAAEKAAAEKAAAEKAAAEKAAAEKAAAIRKEAAEKSDVKVSYEPAPAQVPPKEPSDPVDKTIKIAAAGLAFLILLIIGASSSNSSKYYMSDNQGILEIWKGKFAPLGAKKLIALPNTPVPDVIKDVYRSGEVYPLIFNYYIDEADTMLDVTGTPDFEQITVMLKSALEYGSTKELRDLAYARLDNIDRLILTYKAEVATSRGTIDDLKAAIGYLEEISNLTSDDAGKDAIAQKIAAHDALIQQLEEEQAAAEQAAAEQAAAEQAAAEQAAAEQAAAEQAAAEQAAAEQAAAESEDPDAAIPESADEQIETAGTSESKDAEHH